MTDDDRADRADRIASPWEWAVAALSTLLVAGMLSLLAYEAVTDSGTPALIRVRAGPAVRFDGGFLVPVRAENTGSEAAASVRIEGSLLRGATAVETGEATMDYIPGHSHGRAALIFAHDPRGLRIEVRATGYEEP